MSLYFRLFDQRISGKHHCASSTTESSGLVTWPRFFFRKEHRHRVLIDSDLLWWLGCGWLWMAVEYVMWICGMDMSGWNSDFVEMVSLGARLTLSSLHSDCSHRRGSHMFQNRWTDGVNDALLKANGTAAVKDMNYALLASRPTMFGNEPHTQQTNWSMHTIWHIQIYTIWYMIHMMIQVCERLLMWSSCSLFESMCILYMVHPGASSSSFQVYHIWASLAAFAVGFCLPEVAFTAVPFASKQQIVPAVRSVQTWQ